MSDHRLPLGIEQFAQLCIITFGQQSPVGDLADVAGIQFNRYREAVTQFVEFGCIQRRSFDNFRQGLLASGNDPHLASTHLLERASQTIQVEDQFTPGSYILPGFVDQKEDILPPGHLAHYLDHASRQVSNRICHFELESQKTIRFGEILRHELRQQL